MIKEIVAKFQIEEGKYSIREEDNLLGEREINISDSKSENEAQINASKLEFNNDSKFFEL